ncbi:MAG: hypothetical protein HZB55_19900 [Deltaproteobacteria bacterium]|nr:hypothetical protein [Deltaproteobacteria bacterium]
MEPAASRLAALFVLGLLVFFSPIVIAVNRPVGIFGFPLFPLYLFACWSALILLAWWIARRGRP